ncbi:MAG: hypothetical protein U0640_07000 [Phycisphaerales bacterium]
MKKVLALLAVAGLASAAQASVTFTDSQNDLFDNGLAHIDIASVDVSHDANWITFVVNTRGSLDPGNGGTGWGKFCIGIDVPSNATNDTTNGWARNINWNGQAIDFWVGTWTDNNGFGMGGELRTMSGNDDGSNTLTDATYTTGTMIQGSTAAFSQTIRLSRAALGLTGDGTFCFDVLSTGGDGGNPGVDHLSRSTAATPGWGDASTAGTFLCYTIPTPGAAALLGLGGLVAARRRRA